MSMKSPRELRNPTGSIVSAKKKSACLLSARSFKKQELTDEDELKCLNPELSNLLSHNIALRQEYLGI